MSGAKGIYNGSTLILTTFKTKMVKVVLITRMFPNEIEPYSGMFVYEQAYELAKRTELTVINPVDRYPSLRRYRDLNRKREAIPRYRRFEGFRVYSPDYWYLPKLQAKYAHWNLALTVASAIMREARESQLIHIHNAMPDAFAGAVAGRILAKPVVVTCHGSDINIWASAEHPRSRSLITRGLMSARCVIAVSNALKEKIKKLGISEHKIRVIGNGHDPDMFFPMDRTECRRKSGLPLDKMVYLSVGALKPVKGFSALISAYGQLKRLGLDFVAYIVGEGEERDHLASQIRHLGLEETVSLQGALPRKDVAEWMNAADFLVVSSVSEGMPCAVIESLACGTPVLSTPVGGIPEILNPSVGLIGEGLTETALVDVIRRGIHSRFTNGKIAEYARQFKWEYVANQVSQLYEDVVRTWQS
jgi:glycosyltransferase involved in cell wall biosynthesis